MEAKNGKNVFEPSSEHSESGELPVIGLVRVGEGSVRVGLVLAGVSSPVALVVDPRSSHGWVGCRQVVGWMGCRVGMWVKEWVMGKRVGRWVSKGVNE